MIRDSRFRFDVNLATGAETGSVYLSDHIVGPHVTCELKVTGTGKTADGNPTFSCSWRHCVARSEMQVEAEQMPDAAKQPLPPILAIFNKKRQSPGNGRMRVQHDSMPPRYNE